MDDEANPTTAGAAEVAAESREAAGAGQVRAVRADIPGTFQAIASAAEAVGIDPAKLTFEQLMQFADSTREYEARVRKDGVLADEKFDRFRMEREAQTARLSSEQREAEIRERAAQRELGVTLFEQRVRSVLAGLLVLGAVGGVVWGIARGVPGDQLSQYLAPITGLAGIAIGYFFGRQS